jgi:hypothetical protein
VLPCLYAAFTLRCIDSSPLVGTITPSFDHPGA